MGTPDLSTMFQVFSAVHMHIYIYTNMYLHIDIRCSNIRKYTHLSYACLFSGLLRFFCVCVRVLFCDLFVSLFVGPCFADGLFSFQAYGTGCVPK